MLLCKLNKCFQFSSVNNMTDALYSLIVPMLVLISYLYTFYDTLKFETYGTLLG